MLSSGSKPYPALFTLWGIQGLIALAWLLLIPTDADTYSTSRLILIGSVLFLTIASTRLAYMSYSGRLQTPSPHTRRYEFIYLLALLALLSLPASIAILIALGKSVSSIYTSYAERLAPLAFWIALSSMEWCAVHIHSFLKGQLYIRKMLLFTSIVFLLIVLLVLIVRIVIPHSSIGSFGSPPTPFLEWQVALAGLVGLAATIIEARWRPKWRVSLFLVTYIFTCVLWLADPLIPGSTATPPRAPNFELYPFSDAMIYAQYSQSALVGEGFLWPDIPSRPLYVTLLTWMHALVGQNYYHVIALQLLLLALFPASLYLLGRELGSRPVGLMLAFLAAIREITANHVAPFALNHSYSKLFLSEIPTALILVVFLLSAIRWVKAPRPVWFPLMMGGLLGMAALIRLQCVVLLAPLALVSGFPMWSSRKVEWMRGLILIILGVILSVSPWLIRNYIAADGFVFDNPISQSMVLARRWSGDNGNTFIGREADETTAQYTHRLTTIALDSFKRNPGRILSGMVDHFFVNMYANLTILPVRDRLQSVVELLMPQHAFWQSGARSPLLSTFYLALLTLGLAIAWNSHRWIGMLPFALSLAYHASTSFFLSSGDRFILPIDWTWTFYDCLGLLFLAKLALAGLYELKWNSDDLNVEAITVEESRSSQWNKLALTFGLILLAGSSLPLTEFAFPSKYPPVTQNLLFTSAGIDQKESTHITYGRAIFPRYYEVGEGEPGSAKLGYGVSDQSRLVFWLEGPEPGLVILPLKTTPGFFPNASDVWVVSNELDGSSSVRFVKVEKDGKTAIYESK